MSADQFANLPIEKLQQYFLQNNWSNLQNLSDAELFSLLQEMFQSLIEKQYPNSGVHVVLSLEYECDEYGRIVEGEYNPDSNTIYVYGLKYGLGLQHYATVAHEMQHQQQHIAISQYCQNKSTTFPNIEHFALAKMFYDKDITHGLYKNNYMEIDANGAAIVALAELQNSVGFHKINELPYVLNIYKERLYVRADEKNLETLYKNYSIFFKFQQLHIPQNDKWIQHFESNVEQNIYTYFQQHRLGFIKNVRDDIQKATDVYQKALTIHEALDKEKIPVDEISKELQQQCHILSVYSTDVSQKVGGLLNQNHFPYITDVENNRVYIPKEIPGEIQQQIDAIVHEDTVILSCQSYETLDELIERQSNTFNDNPFEGPMQDEER